MCCLEFTLQSVCTYECECLYVFIIHVISCWLVCLCSCLCMYTVPLVYMKACVYECDSMCMNVIVCVSL